MTDFSIDGTTLSSLGFKLKDVIGVLQLGEPKQQGSGSDEYTSINSFDAIYKQKSPEPIIEFFGKFSSIAAAETALFTLYGMLIQNIERTFTVFEGAKSISFKGVMHKGASVEPTKSGSRMYFEIKLKLLKTNDLV